MSALSGAARRPQVTAVIVSHDGASWLPTLLRALGSSTVRPDRAVCVDTASGDSSRALVVEALGTEAVVDAPARTGFGAAVALGLDTVDTWQESGRGRRTAGSVPTPSDDWVWLLHDDCAPAPDALEQLLATAASDSSIGAVGCRLRAWPRGRRLLEVGVTMTGTGRRVTGLEPGETDQGQYDEVRTVLAVSSAGMLVRRREWDVLNGFDDRLPLFRDDVDFGWRMARAGSHVAVSPGAVVFHAEAATRGVRTIANTSARPHRADRAAAIFTLLANSSGRGLAWQYTRLVAGSLLRAVGYLLGKLPATAYDEVAAMVATVARPDRILAARSSRRATSTTSAGQVRSRFPPWWTPYLDGLDAVRSRLAGRSGSRTAEPTRAADLAGRATVGGGATALPVELEAAVGPGSWMREHPALVPLLLLTVGSLVAARGLLGNGLLEGGALLPAPGGARDWWRLYAEERHSVALGSGLVTAPYVVALGVVGTLALGKAWLAVDVLVLFGVPLSAAGAYVATGRFIGSIPTRVWMAVSYGLLPVLTGAVTTGHLGTLAACIGFPWLLRAVLPLFDREGAPTWRTAWGSGLVLAVVTAFAPLTWLIAAVLLGLALPWLAVRGRMWSLPRAMVALGLPVVLLAPWSLRVVANPAEALTEAGLVEASTVSVADIAWQLPFGRLGATGAAPWWLTASVLVAAAAAVLRRDRRTGVAAAWLVLAVSLATAAVLSRAKVPVPGVAHDAFVWLGLPVLVAQGAAVVAAGLAADGLFAQMRRLSFGPRQPIAAAVGALALAAPLVGAAWWLVVAPVGELSRSDVTPLPTYMADTLTSDPSQRALVVRRDGRNVTFEVVAGDGLRLGDDSVVPPQESIRLGRLVADLLSEADPADVGRLATFGISYVVLAGPAPRTDVAMLDGLPGLTRASTDANRLAGWQVPASATTPVRVILARSAAVAESVTAQPSLVSAHRGVWLGAQAVAWFVALVAAAPSLARGGDIGPDEP